MVLLVSFFMTCSTSFITFLLNVLLKRLSTFLLFLNLKLALPFDISLFFFNYSRLFLTESQSYRRSSEMWQRNRMIRSSSLGETGLSIEAMKSCPPPPVEAAKKPSPRGGAILTLSSPRRAEEEEEEYGCEWSKKNVDERYGRFLRACYHCKERISESDDVYMYGYGFPPFPPSWFFKKFVFNCINSWKSLPYSK